MPVSHTRGTSGTRLVGAGKTELRDEHGTGLTREHPGAFNARDQVDRYVSFRGHAMAERPGYSGGACEQKKPAQLAGKVPIPAWEVFIPRGESEETD